MCSCDYIPHCVSELAPISGRSSTFSIFQTKSSRSQHGMTHRGLIFLQGSPFCSLLMILLSGMIFFKYDDLCDVLFLIFHCSVSECVNKKDNSIRLLFSLLLRNYVSTLPSFPITAVVGSPCRLIPCLFQCSQQSHGNTVCFLQAQR